MTTRRMRAACLLGLCSVGCSFSDGSSGELGNGSFRHICTLEADATCSELNEIEGFKKERDLGQGNGVPGAVAVGSLFGLEHKGDSALAAETRIEAAFDEDEESNDAFSIDQEVQAAFLATDSRGRVMDFIVIQALEATSLSVWNSQTSIEYLELGEGDSEQLSVTPVSDDGQLLGGAMPYSWDILDPEIATIGRPDDSSAGGASERNVVDLRIVGRSAGTTRLTVRSGDLVRSVVVEVKP